MNSGDKFGLGEVAMLIEGVEVPAAAFVAVPKEHTAVFSKPVDRPARAHGNMYDLWGERRS